MLELVVGWNEYTVIQPYRFHWRSRSDFEPTENHHAENPMEYQGEDPTHYHQTDRTTFPSLVCKEASQPSVPGTNSKLLPASSVITTPRSWNSATNLTI